MVETARSIERISARPEQENNSAPTATTRLFEQSVDIMRAKRSLETVKQNEERRVCIAREVMKLEKVSIGCIDALQSEVQRQSRARELSPQRLKVGLGKPPRWGKGSLRQEGLGGIQSNLFTTK